jgi:hypothetical protein
LEGERRRKRPSSSSLEHCTTASLWKQAGGGMLKSIRKHLGSGKEDSDDEGKDGGSYDRERGGAPGKKHFTLGDFELLETVRTWPSRARVLFAFFCY